MCKNFFAIFIEDLLKKYFLLRNPQKSKFQNKEIDFTSLFKIWQVTLLFLEISFLFGSVAI